MNEKLKLTQGQTKAKQRLKELFENEVFNDELKKILASPNKSKRLFKFAQKYGLDMEVGSPFLDYLSRKKLPKKAEISLYDSDVCMVVDEVDELLYPEEGHPKYKALPDKKLELNLYPIHLCISPRATKRDVLDFISKRWFYIRDMLDMYLDFDEKPKIVRSKPKAERDRFIWENQNLPASKVAELLNKKYPDGSFTYSDVNSILYYLRKRRRSKVV